MSAEIRRMKLRVFPNLRALKGHNRVHLLTGHSAHLPGALDFQCNMCHFSGPDRGAVLRHMRTHNGDRPYECALCNYAFTTKANCERHLRNRHAASRYSTLKLSETDDTEEEEEEHEEKVEGPLDLSMEKLKKPPPPSAASSVKMVIKNGVLVPKQKQRRYRTERPFGCEHCSAKFTLRSNMERHVKQQHPQFWSRRGPRGSAANRRPQQQTHNNKQIVNNNNHLPDLASVSKLLDNASTQTFSHDIASVTSDDEEGLVASHSEESEENNGGSSGKKKSAYSLAPNRVSCPYCLRKFPWSSSLRRHVLTHTGQKPYKCPHCPLLFTTKSNCDRHLTRKHGSSVPGETPPPAAVQPPPTDQAKMPFKCHLCEGAFAERQDALDHMRELHEAEYSALVSKGALESSCEEETPRAGRFPDYANRKVMCAFCLRRFWSAEDLRRHMRTHTGERPFSCDVCTRKFTLKHSMLRHRKKHSAAAAADSDLIGDLLGIGDKSLVDSILDKSADDAARLLGVVRNN
ncbi:hypothetical protein AAG570_007345 [Ranatra chinensis]|uniref:C2H2-type domain-containing protein n=1 Tax=Ranatra chinensis TaxID=642074 RepID=A0ABD0XYA2_9HEMI